MSKCFRCIEQLLVNLHHDLSTDMTTSGHDTNITESMARLAEVVVRKMCDQKWEVRDTTLEFVGNLARNVKGENM